jgi:hypothetical protein
MPTPIDAYYALRPERFSTLSGAVLQGVPGSPYGLSLVLTLSESDSSPRRLRLSFTGVSGLTIGDFSGPSISMFEITSTRDRGWESPRYLVSSDQGSWKFGCAGFECEEVSATG